jgi:uridine kinase
MVETSSIKSIAALADQSVLALRRISRKQASLVGISGIDASGKGYVTAQLAERLRDHGWKVGAICADDWLNLPSVYMNEEHPAEHFYEYAIRLEDMFERLVLPLKQTRQVDLFANCANPRATVHRPQRYKFHKIDIVLLEGIFLFKPPYRDHFDLKVWIDCSFDVALQRAVARGQEGLPPEETKRAFETIYFPAQRIHLDRDRPVENADIVFCNR